MTVLVAAKEDDKVVLVSDRQWSCYHWTGEVTKQFQKRGMVFAACGSLNEIQPVMNLLSVPPRNEDQNDDSYMFSVAESIRSFMMNRLDDKKLKHIDSSFIVVSKMGVYNIDRYFTVSKFTEFCADGSGCDVAEGAYYALKDNTELTVEERCRKSVEIAMSRTLFCGKGLDVKVIELFEPES